MMPSLIRKDSGNGMVAAVLNYVGLGSAPSVEDDKSALRALPANWYTSQEMYELEKRAIFSRKWQLVTHKTRLQKPGDWLKFDIAGFEFVLTHDRQGKINGFHNVCRHRAYPVVTGGECGSAKIFSCKYHGWSYGLNGKLAKAPGYQDLEGFQKEKNGLFPIHVRTDHQGFIWINLDSKEEPEVTWEEDFDGIDRQARYEGLFNPDDYVYDHSWQMEGAYNWKILADNYNECYHCATTHPDLPAVANLESYDVQTKFCQIIHDPATTDDQKAKGLTIASTYYFPNVSTNITPNFFMIQRFVPSGPLTSVMSYQIFRNKNASDADFALVDGIYKRVMSEDKELCDKAQRNLNAGIFINGEMHPKLEKGPLYFQKKVRECVTSHWAREQKAREEIWPARQRLEKTATQKQIGLAQADVDFCKGLECPAKANEEGLAW